MTKQIMTPIKAFMAQRKREWHSSHKTKDNFPRWEPRMSIAEYVAMFEHKNWLKHGAVDVSRGGPYDHRATLLFGPEVVEEDDE